MRIVGSVCCCCWNGCQDTSRSEIEKEDYVSDSGWFSKPKTEEQKNLIVNAVETDKEGRQDTSNL